MYFSEELRLLDFAADYFRRTSLADAHLIACQHILPSTHRMLGKLIELGLKRENIAVVGKCYSTSRLVMRNLRTEGIRVDAASIRYDGHAAFDDYFHEGLRRFLRGEIARRGLTPESRILILDDGGELLDVARTELAGFRRIMGVEQTSSGFNKLRASELGFPVLNVARSRGKLHYETPMIADSQMRAIERAVVGRASAGENILILGNGFIGAALRERLRPHFAAVDTLDVADRARIAETLGGYDIVIGATGTVSLPSHFHSRLKRPVTLISASTSDRELDAVHLRRRIEPRPDCHEDLRIDGVTLVNSGFPVNFSGADYDNVPLRDIQLTFALLLGALCHERPERNGFVGVDERFQDGLIGALANR